MKIQRLNGDTAAELLSKEETIRRQQTALNSEDLEVPFNTGIPDYLINSLKTDRVVYCRFGQKYIIDLEKKKNANIASAPHHVPGLGSFSYLINVKKLIEEHNINSEKREFKTMRGQQMTSKRVEPELQ